MVRKSPAGAGVQVFGLQPKDAFHHFSFAADGYRRTSVFAAGKNLGAGRIHFARAFKSVRDPIRPWPDGHKAHIGEVQVSIWDEGTMAACDASGIILL